MGTASDLRQGLPGYFSMQTDFSNGEEYVLTISGDGIEAVGQNQDECPVVAFKESKKKLVLNATRLRQLGNLFGDEDLLGKQVKLKKGVVTHNNRQFETICVEEAS